jgi:hypothetical protein
VGKTFRRTEDSDGKKVGRDWSCKHGSRDKCRCYDCKELEQRRRQEDRKIRREMEQLRNVQNGETF